MLTALRRFESGRGGEASEHVEKNKNKINKYDVTELIFRLFYPKNHYISKTTGPRVVKPSLSDAQFNFMQRSVLLKVIFGTFFFAKFA